MKVCMPIQRDNALNSSLSDHFGSAPCFLIYDTVSKSVETIINGDSSHQHGMCNPLGLIRGKGIAAVLCRGLGARVRCASKCRRH